MKRYETIAKEEIFNEFPEKVGKSLMEYCQGICTIETLITTARILNLEIFELGDFIVYKIFRYKGSYSRNLKVLIE